MSRGMLSWVMFIAGALLLAAIVSNNMAPETPLSISKFLKHAEQDHFKTLKILEDRIEGEFKTGVQGLDKSTGSRFVVKYPPKAIDSELVSFLVEKCTSAEIVSADSNSFFLQLLVNFIPWLLIIFFIWFFVIRQIRATGGGAGMLGSFGRSRHRVSNRELANVTLNDVAGVEEAKEEVGEIVEFLRNPRKFQRLGGRIPRGVLLVGEPGCGKTLLAKAIAGEAEVPFFSISGSDFVEMFVGVGASRVRDLFKQAKDNAPCIIFLDEIDAVGRKRGVGFNGGGHDEREQTLNAILVEMDGFDTSDQVIVIAATNREDVLDPALTRPGRFDRRVYVPLPDIKGRLEILKVHAKKVKLGPGVDLMRLARGTPMFSGAELAAIINESALIATMADKEAIEMDDLEEARDKVRWGRAHKSRAIDEKEKELTAYHEAGHAILTHLLPDAEPLHKVSIIPRAQSLGQTLFLPEKDRYTTSRNQAKAHLQVLFGGRIAEEMFFSDVTSGAAMDIMQATRLARTMVCDWGMSEALGPIRYGVEEGRQMWIEPPGVEYSDKTAERIDHEVRKFIEEANAAARKLLEENRSNLKALAEALLKFETLDRAEVDRILRGESLDRPTLTDLLDQQQPPPRKPEVSARPAEPKDLPLPAPGGPLPQPG
ncbi:MAG: ATP-dependent zinc metalloprotease FtsH [Phycisphaerae bacterium]|nr:ATP-dependent zinc metalloprotease FtsH [Phycisphaerae bacterium]